MGKSLYEAATGMPLSRFPELPHTLAEGPETLDMMRLNSIILRACEEDRNRRYKSAAELRGYLLDLQRHLGKG